MYLQTEVALAASYDISYSLSPLRICSCLQQATNLAPNTLWNGNGQ